MSYRPAELEAEMMAAQPYNAADPKQVNEARKKAARRKKKMAEVTKAIMSTPEGRMWMMDVLESCKVFGNPIVAGDPHFTYHNIGEQNIGKKLLQDVNDAAIDEYVMMIKEAREYNK